MEELSFEEHVRLFGRILRGGEGESEFIDLAERAGALGDLERAVVGDSGRSAVVVGEHGVGKTALVRAVAQRAAEAGTLVFEASSSELMAGQSFIGQVDGRLQLVAQAGRERRVLWLLPDPRDALTAGAFTGSPVGLLDRLIPYLERGEITLLMEATPTAWSLVTQARPRLRGLVETIRLEPLEREAALTLGSRWLERHRLAVDPDVLSEALTLAEEYVHAAAPGNLLGVLRLAEDRRRGDGEAGHLRLEDVLGALSTATGVPLEILDVHRRLDLQALEAYFAAAVVGQPAAVGQLVERLSLIKAGLTDPTRPLGVFLFVGPTGTGKTELAKSVAEYLFGSPRRLVRLDMSEFQTSESLERLLAPPDASASAALLPKVRGQPFSVVLLDEFEKAHRHIWDVFLQLFDDGRLTDAAGEVVDFRHCLVILTSNVGVGAAKPAGLGFGRSEVPFDERALIRALEGTFSPEFLNRIDRTVVFRPLTPQVMKAIVRKELREISTRRGLRTRPWAIEWDESTVELLVQRGFSPDYGARPLKRAVEQYVLAPLADAIVERAVPHGDQFLFVRATADQKIEVQFVDPDTELPHRPVAEPPGTSLRTLARDGVGLPDEASYLKDQLEHLAHRIRGPEWSERKAALMQQLSGKGFWDSRERFAVLDDIELRDRLEAGFSTAESLMTRLSRALGARDRTSTRLCRLLAQRLYLISEALAALDAGDPQDAELVVRPTDSNPDTLAFAGEIVAMYKAWAEKRGMKLEELDPSDDASAGTRLAVSGFAAARILAAEAGLHLLEKPRGQGSFTRAGVLVQVRNLPPAEPQSRSRREPVRASEPPEANREVARRYRRDPSPLVRDRSGWNTGRLQAVLGGDFDLFA